MTNITNTLAGKVCHHPEFINIELLTVMLTDKGFSAKAQLLSEAAGSLQIIVRFRNGCNDFPVAGQVWEVKLSRSDEHGIIVDAMLRVSD